MLSINNTDQVKNRLLSIDVLRGLAALTVLLYHARSMIWIGLRETYNRHGLYLNIDAYLAYASFPLFFGGLAVNLFFVLSGYCIHRRGAKLLAQDPQGRLNISKFVVGRFWRIYPTYVSALIITFLVDTYLLASKLEYLTSAILPETISFSTFIASLFSLQGIVAPYFGSNGVFWTLAVEIHFYIIYPFLFYLSRKYGSRKTLSISLIISVIYILVDESIGLTNALPYSRPFNPVFIPHLFLWVFGFYIAEVEAGRAFFPVSKFIKPITALSTVFMLGGYACKLQILTLLASAVTFGGLIYWSTTPSGNNVWDFWLGHILSKIGKFSYSLYSVHVPFLLLILALVSPSGEKLTVFFPVVLSSFLVTCMAWIVFMLVERWTLKPIILKRL